jgi:ribosome biogenesis GTPase
LTKCDLADEGAPNSLAERLVGVDVLATSATTGRGVDELRRRLQPACTAVLLGPSGAGKSTLANVLAGFDMLSTGAVRDRDRRGRHTTTSRQLINLPGGGMLIDTPGLRSLGLAGDVPVEAAFPDIERLAASCRFSDCRHQTEPGCAVAASVASGQLDGDRLASFHKLQREAAAEARRSDPLLRRAELSVWKARAKSARLNTKRRR